MIRQGKNLLYVLVGCGILILGCTGSGDKTEPETTPTTTAPPPPTPPTQPPPGQIVTTDDCKLPPFLLYPSATILGGAKGRDGAVKVSACGLETTDSQDTVLAWYRTQLAGWTKVTDGPSPDGHELFYTRDNETASQVIVYPENGKTEIIVARGGTKAPGAGPVGGPGPGKAGKGPRK